MLEPACSVLLLSLLLPEEGIIVDFVEGFFAGCAQKDDVFCLSSSVNAIHKEYVMLATIDLIHCKTY
jgi:hypothetical protein